MAPSTTTAPVLLYDPQSFVIWGANAVRPRVGNHVNFWGSQWDNQVTAGRLHDQSVARP